MAGVNKAIIMGHLGRDPEVRYQQSGAAIATLNIATSETYKDRDGNKQERTEWHRVVLFGRTAEVAGEYLRKGSMAYVEGRLQTRKWTDKEGQDRYTTEIVGDRLQLVGGNGGKGGNSGGDGQYDDYPEAQGSGQQRQQPRQSNGQQRQPAPAQAQRRAAPPPVEDYDDSDIPF